MKNNYLFLLHSFYDRPSKVRLLINALVMSSMWSLITIYDRFPVVLQPSVFQVKDITVLMLQGW